VTARKPDGSGVPRQDGIKGLFAWFSLDQTTAAEVRSETWALGTRRLGRPLDGALRELEGGGLPRRRARLLRACVRKLRRA